MAKDISGPPDDKAKVESGVRAAAIAAARGVPLGEYVLSKIVAEASDPSLNEAERASRAASLGEHYAASEKPLNHLAATQGEIDRNAAAARFATQRGGLEEFAKARREKGGSEGTIESRDPRSSGDYDKIAGGNIDRAVYKSLLAEGITPQQMRYAVPFAQALGWTDKDSVRNLANAGREFSSAVVQYDKARKNGDTAGMNNAEKKFMMLMTARPIRGPLRRKTNS